MAYSYSISKDEQASALFKSIFKLPLPMSGSAISKLSDVPTCIDYTHARGSTREIAITTWNTQCHHYPTSFGYTVDVPVTADRPTRRQDRVTVLIDGALAQVVAKLSQINSVTRRKILQGKGIYIATNAARLNKLPRNYLTRSSPLTDAAANDLARAFDEGRLTTQPPELPAGCSDTGETITRNINTPTTQDAPTAHASAQTPPENQTLRAAKPGKSGSSTVVPVREVRTVAMMFKGYELVKPPRSAAYTAIESYATNSDRAATQPYISAARGVLARDMPAIQEIISYVSAYNASYVDTAPALRGLLYVYPRAQDVWGYDSFDARFVRRMQLSTRISDGLHWHQTPQAERIRIRVVAVSLPAFASHLKNLDPGMSDVGADGIALSGMDTSWTAIPVSSDLLGNPWLLEFLLTFLPTRIWAGKLCHLSRATLSTDRHDANAKYTGMPAAHQVHIPGPTKLVLVMLDENTYAQAGIINITGIGNLNVYRGARIAQGERPFNGFWADAQDAFYNLFTNEVYPASCQNMVKALQFMEDTLCTSYAYQLALTLAAEIASYVPESPHLHGDDRGLYNDELGGGWTIGAHNFNTRHPYHTTSNINDGTEAEVRTRIKRLVLN